MTVWLVVFEREGMEGMALVKARAYEDVKPIISNIIKQPINVIGIRRAERIKDSECGQVLYAYEVEKGAA